MSLLFVVAVVISIRYICDFFARITCQKDKTRGQGERLDTCSTAVVNMRDFYVPTLREAPAEAEIASHILLLRAGCIRKLSSGLYSFLPLAVRSLHKIEAIIRDELNRQGAQEVLLPILGPAELWEESGRIDAYGPELMTIQDRHERTFVLGPTHEEVMVDLVRGEVKSYKQLPLNLYQIQDKFRDEMRPRFGLMRGREFIMKDSYSFDATQDDMQITYNKMRQAYEAINKRCGLRCIAVSADSGEIGGSSSLEFMALAEEGEAEVVYCACGYAADKEKYDSDYPKLSETNTCPHCENKLMSARGIEVSQIFQLQDKYSRPLGATFLDKDGKPQYFQMGCYGIGVSRLLAAAVAQSHDSAGIIWPRGIAPFDAEIVLLDPDDAASQGAACSLAEELAQAGFEVLIDDRAERAGVKFADADLIGLPAAITIGKRSLKEAVFEYRMRCDMVEHTVEARQCAHEIGEKLASV